MGSQCGEYHRLCRLVDRGWTKCAAKRARPDRHSHVTVTDRDSGRRAAGDVGLEWEKMPVPAGRDRDCFHASESTCQKHLYLFRPPLGLLHRLRLCLRPQGRFHQVSRNSKRSWRRIKSHTPLSFPTHLLSSPHPIYTVDQIDYVCLSSPSSSVCACSPLYLPFARPCMHRFARRS